MAPRKRSSRRILFLLSVLREKRATLQLQRQRLQCRVTKCQRRRLCGLLWLIRRQRRRCRNKRSSTSRRWFVRPIFADHDTHGAWATLIPQMRKEDEEKFYNFMRMTPECFDDLLVLVEPFLQKRSFRKAICPGERLALTLRYLASGDSAVSLSFLFRVSPQVISNILLETLTVIWLVLKDIVFEKLTEEMWLRVASEFEVYWNFPHCCGAVDGKHVRIRAFPHCGSRCWNYKNFHSIILQIVADARLRFIIVESGASGRRGDGNVSHHSAFGKMLKGHRLNLPPPCPVEGMEGDIPFFFVGDAAFQGSQNLLKPKPGRFLDSVDRLFNYRLSRARNMSENSLGLLVARFGVLQKPMSGSEALCKAAVLACAALHNLHLKREDSIPPLKRRYCPQGFTDHVDSNGNLVSGRWRNEFPDLEQSCFQSLETQVAAAKGRAEEVGVPETSAQDEYESVVHKFSEFFIDHSVPWQWKQIHLM